MLTLKQTSNYPTAERYGWVWVFVGDLAEEERPPLPPLPEYGDPDWRALHGEFLWNAHYTRVVENGMDFAHAPFVHARSFGNPDKPVVLTRSSCGISTIRVTESLFP